MQIPVNSDLVGLSNGRKIAWIAFGLAMMIFMAGLLIGFLLGEADQIATIDQNADDYMMGRLMQQSERSMEAISKQTDALIRLAEQGCMNPASEALPKDGEPRLHYPN